MIKFNKPPIQDQKIAVSFDNMAKRFKENKEVNAKHLLDKLKGMEYHSKNRNKDDIDKHQFNAKLYNQWREFIRGDTGVAFGYEYTS
jgi:hypothetical protein